MTVPGLRPLGLFFAFKTDFTNITVMLSDQLRNLSYNRSAHCTQRSDQCPLGLFFFKLVIINKSVQRVISVPKNDKRLVKIYLLYDTYCTCMS